MRNWKKYPFSIAIALLLVFALISSLNYPTLFVIRVYGADAYGNQIHYIEVYTYFSSNTSYVLKANFTATGGSVRIPDNQYVRFVVRIKLNSTLASSTDEAISYTRVYMNITNGGSIWLNKELNNTVCWGAYQSFYWLKERGDWNQSGYPVSGVTYSCSAKYQAYY